MSFGKQKQEILEMIHNIRNETARMVDMAGINEAKFDAKTASHKNKTILNALVKLIAPQGDVNKGIEEALYELDRAKMKDEAKKVRAAHKKAQDQLAIIAKIFGDATSDIGKPGGRIY